MLHFPGIGTRLFLLVRPRARREFVVKILWQAFVESFKEGLALFFSPFTGFWHAIGNLRIPAMVHGIFKSGEKGVAQH